MLADCSNNQMDVEAMKNAPYGVSAILTRLRTVVEAMIASLKAFATPAESYDLLIGAVVFNGRFITTRKVELKYWCSKDFRARMIFLSLYDFLVQHE